MDECDIEVNAKAQKADCRRHTAIVVLACFLLSFLCITIVSKTSFLYSFHDGSDINWFLTVGRGIVKGKVPYKDLFEQKGVLLYMLFALNYVICGNNFIVIYIIQVLCFTAFLYFSYRIIMLYKPERYAVTGTGITALAVSCCNAYFSGGGEVEEYCLPMVAYGLYVFLNYAKNGGDKIPLKHVALCGFFAGCIFWMKYTMLSFYGAFAVCVLVDRFIKHDAKSALVYAGVFLGGFVLISIPWIIYLGVNGAIDDMLKVYIFDNIFSYAGGGSVLGLFSKIGSSLGKVLKNFILYIFIICGLVYFFRGVGGIKRRFKIYLAAMFFALLFVQCLINGGLSYYHLIMGAFVPLGVAGFTWCLARAWAGIKYIFAWFRARKHGGSVPSYADMSRRANNSVDGYCGGMAERLKVGVNVHTALLALFTITVVCLLFGNCTLAMFYTRENYTQTVLAEMIVPEEEEEETGEEEEDEPLYLLCYKILERGFYATCDEAPEFYYFAQNNFSYEAYPEMYDEMESYVLNGEAAYVVTDNDIWEEEKETYLYRYEYVEDLSYYHVEFNTDIRYLDLCLLVLDA